jgi:hypothetical protein
LPKEPFKTFKSFDPHSHFAPIVGVTRNMGIRPVEIRFWASREHAPYIRTKPIHSTQQVLEEDANGSVFSITVIPNLELERELLGFGEGLRVHSPDWLVQRMQRRIRKMQELYQSDASSKTS